MEVKCTNSTQRGRIRYIKSAVIFSKLQSGEFARVRGIMLGQRSERLGFVADDLSQEISTNC